jgi:cell division protein FtsL
MKKHDKMLFIICLFILISEGVANFVENHISRITYFICWFTLLLCFGVCIMFYYKVQRINAENENLKRKHNALNDKHTKLIVECSEIREQNICLKNALSSCEEKCKISEELLRVQDKNHIELKELLEVQKGTKK